MDRDERYGKPGFAYGTGGPPSLDMLMSLEELKRELAGLKFVHAVQLEREVRERTHRSGFGGAGVGL